ncbi:MAG: biotin/lipoyl-containing protein [Acidobacteriota bacterium]
MLLEARTEKGAVLVRVEKLGDSYRIFLGEKEFNVNVKKVEKSFYSILHDNRTYDLSVEDSGKHVQVTLNGETFHIELVNPLYAATGAGAEEIKGRQVIKSVMPGKVIKLLVSEGDSVDEGQGLLIIEAMKMENEIASPKSGRVTEIKVREGWTVEADAELLVVD